MELETPTSSVIKAANQTVEVTDADGRILKLRKMGTLDRMRLFEVVGAENVKNEAYFGYAVLAAHVIEVNGEPVQRPTSRRTLEALVQMLGDAGLNAAAEGISKNFMVKVPGIDEGDALKNE